MEEEIMSTQYLMLNLPLHGSVMYDLQWGKEQVIDKCLDLQNDYYTKEYHTTTSLEFQKLVKFITDDSEKIHGRCPKCNKDTFFDITKGCDLDEEITSNTLFSYTEEELNFYDEDSYIPSLEEIMEKRVERLLKKAMFFDKYFNCPQCKSLYKVSFVLISNKEKEIKLMKIGQYPPATEFLVRDLEGLEKNLDKFSIKSDYRNALRNSANGDHIGAFVYLRRIIERYIQKKYETNMKNIKEKKEDFLKKKTVDKISILKEYVPKILVDNKQIYAIISMGIHELSEEECSAYYPCLKNVIDYVLQAELSEKLEKKATSQVQEILRKKSKSVKNDKCNQCSN